ncbi:MAG: hypothetical protein ACKV2Q_36610 [Planctomycetaceae bacterium]
MDRNRVKLTALSDQAHAKLEPRLEYIEALADCIKHGIDNNLASFVLTRDDMVLVCGVLFAYAGDIRTRRYDSGHGTPDNETAPPVS